MFVWEGFSRNGKIEIPKDITVFEFESLYNLPNHLVEDGYKLVNTSWMPLYIVRSGNPDPNVLPLKWGQKKFMIGICGNGKTGGTNHRHTKIQFN